MHQPGPGRAGNSGGSRSQSQYKNENINNGGRNGGTKLVLAEVEVVGIIVI